MNVRPQAEGQDAADALVGNALRLSLA